MFIGHFGVGLAAKRVAPAVSLGTFFLAAQLADLVWPVLVLTGVEVVEIDPGATVVTPLAFVHYPYSHSLVAMALLGALLAGAHFLARRPRLRDSAILGALVVSHWLLDFIVHRPDLPLTLRDERHFGLGLWQSPAATVAVELPLFLAGLALYARATSPRDRAGSLGLWGLVGFLLAIYLANLFGPPPPSATAVAWAGNTMWLLVFWAYWVDRHRQVR